MTLNKAILYTRKSRDDDGNTLELQRDRLEAYCKLNQLDIVEIIEERGVSGSIPLEKREGGQRAIKLIKEKQADHIIALKLDRLFRNVVDCCEWTNKWHKTNISLHLVDMGGTSINSGSSVGSLFLTLLSAFAQFERDTLAERTSASLQHKKKNRIVYNHLPYGFDKVNDNLIDNEVEQKVIAEMRSMSNNGATLNAIANSLNSRNITGKQGGKWYARTVKNVLEFSLTG